jgi:hypothetical protein
MSATRLRSDGRLEVADSAEANRLHGCTVDSECILTDAHPGPCSHDREVDSGADQDYEEGCDGSCIERPHIYTYGEGRFSSPVCQRNGCNVMGTGDRCGDGECEGGDRPGLT